MRFCLRGLENSRNMSLARYDRAKPVGWRGKIAFDQEINGISRQAGVTHRIACPLSDHIQVDKLGLDLPLQKDEVDLVIRRKR